jgi:hypothetical protein
MFTRANWEVKPPFVVERIARGIAETNAEAAREYRQKAGLRREIELSAVNSGEGV